MSVGVGLGILNAYIDEARGTGEAFISEINKALQARGHPPYREPEVVPDGYVDHCFRRSATDHHWARYLSGLASYAVEHLDATQSKLIAYNPFRVAFLPFDFSPPIETAHEEVIGDETVKIWVGSAPRLLLEIAALAPELGIPLVDGHLADTTAEAINEYEPLYSGDACEYAEERTAWLLMYEGARLAVSNQVALSFAG